MTSSLSTRGAFFVAGFCLSSLAPIVPDLKTRLALDDRSLGLLLLCIGVGSILVMPLGGGFAARFGCRPVIVVSTLVLTASLVILALAQTTAITAIALLLMGAGAGTLDVTMNVQAVIVEKEAKKPMMSGFHGMFSVGGIFGAGGVSGLIALGAKPSSALEIVAIASLLLLAAFAKALLPYGGDSDSPPFAFPRGKVLLFGAFCFILFMAEGSVLDWGGVLLTSFRDMDPARTGLGYVAFAAMMTVNRLAGDPIVQALGGQRIVLLGSLCGAAGFALAVLAPVWPLSLVGFALVGIGLSNVVPVMFTAAGRQDSMPANLAVSAITTMGYAGILAGPPLLGFIAHESSLPLAYGIVALLLALVAFSYRLVPK